MTRVDDVINTAGHRLSTGRLEEVINDHSSVVESAVVGHNDEIRGECPVAFVILKGQTDNLTLEEKTKLTREINEKVALGHIKEMKFEEIERIIEARFENTQLRGSMLISIKRSLLTRK